MPKYIPIAKIREMSDKELIALSEERNSKGNYSLNAENAMRVRRERSGNAQWIDIGRHSSSLAGTLNTERGSNFTKKFK